jgi:hypothetical protein
MHDLGDRQISRQDYSVVCVMSFTKPFDDVVKAWQLGLFHSTSHVKISQSMLKCLGKGAGTFNKEQTQINRYPLNGQYPETYLLLVSTQPLIIPEYSPKMLSDVRDYDVNSFFAISRMILLQ